MTSERYEIQTYLAELPRRAGDPDNVALLIRHGSVIEYEGDLCVGVCLTPDGARELANDLIQFARMAEGE